MQPQVTENTGHPRRWAILGVLVVSLLVVVLDNTVLNVALRTIADPVKGLGASQTDLEWAVNSYTLVFAGLLFTAGIVGDRIGRRRMLLIALVVFGLASLASAYSHSPTQLIYARALMGLGAAGIMPSTLSIISNVFDPRERGKAIGIWAGAVGLGIAIGPVVGGALLETFWWGSVFLINVPIVVAGVIAVALMVPESRDPHPSRPDLVGVVLTIVGLVAFVYGIIYGGDHTFGSIRSWGTIVLGAAVLAFFVWYEARSDHPSLDVHLFRNPRFSASIGAVGLVFFAALGTLFFLSFYLQLVRGYSPLQAGLLITPFAVAQLIFAPLSSTMVKRFGPRAVSAVGLSLVTLGLVGLATLGVNSPVWLVCVYFFIQGAGMANVMPPATESIMSSVPRERAGVGSAIQNTVRQVGSALGVAVIGSLVASVFRRDMAPTVSHLPPPVRDAASSSVSSAYSIAPHLGPLGPSVLNAANESFVTAMHWASGVAAVIALGGVGVVLAWLPRTSAPVPPPEPGAHAAPGAPATADASATSGASATPGAPPPAGAGTPAVRSADDRWPPAFQPTLVNGRTRSH